MVLNDFMKIKENLDKFLSYKYYLAAIKQLEEGFCPSVCPPVHLPVYLWDLLTRGQFWPSGIVVAPVPPSIRHQVCPRDNSSPVQAKITKVGPKMQNTLVKVPIFWGGAINLDLQGQI